MEFATACGSLVTVTRGALAHMRAHPVSTEHLSEAILSLRLPRRGTLLSNVDMGRVVGLSTCVAAPGPEEGPAILAAVRKGRREPSRVVVGAEPEPTSSVALVTRTGRSGTYLATAFYGTVSHPEPHDDRVAGEARDAALAFWSRHALVWSAEEFEGPPFETTWRRVMSGRWKRDARAMETVGEEDITDPGQSLW